MNKYQAVYEIRAMKRSLGLRTAISRVQGGKLKAKKEIRIASLFRDVPSEFLKMITLHELTHLKEKEHNKAFIDVVSAWSLTIIK